MNLDFWLSGGSAHVWNPARRRRRGRRRSTTLMQQQAAAGARWPSASGCFARRSGFSRENLPAIYFVAPKVTVAMSRRVGGAVPVLLDPEDPLERRLAVRPAAKPRHRRTAERRELRPQMSLHPLPARRRRAALAARVRRRVGRAAAGAARARATTRRQFGRSPEQIAAERHRLGLDRPFARAVRALARAHAHARSRRVVPVPAAGARSGPAARGQHRAPRPRRAGRRDAARDSVRASSPAAGAAACCPASLRGASLLLLSVPPLISSLVLLTIAARTGWLPVSGMGGPSHLVVPTLALALPVAAMLERLQSQSIARRAGAAVGDRGARARHSRPRASSGATAGGSRSAPILADLRRDRRLAVQRILRRRDRDVVARARRD